MVSAMPPPSLRTCRPALPRGTLVEQRPKSVLVYAGASAEVCTGRAAPPRGVLVPMLSACRTPLPRQNMMFPLDVAITLCSPYAGVAGLGTKPRILRDEAPLDPLGETPPDTGCCIINPPTPADETSPDVPDIAWPPEPGCCRGVITIPGSITTTRCAVTYGDGDPTKWSCCGIALGDFRGDRNP